MPCLKSNRVEINLEALKHNLQALKSLLSSPQTGIMAVVKSDAYGHGLVEVSKALESAGVWGFGISEIEEAYILRDAGLSSPIVLLSGLCPGTEAEVVELGLITGVPDISTLDALEKAAFQTGRTATVHLKIDTGMGRLGLSQSELLQVLQALESWPHLKFEGLFSHLSAADEPEDPLNREQIKRFKDMLRAVKGTGWAPQFVHLANSAGLIHFQDAHFNLVRPGIALYGSYPGDASRDVISLKPVMSFKSKVISVRDVPRGYPISYGHTFVTTRSSKIAVVPVGYDDGYLRALSNRAEVLIQGIRCPVVGRVCMKALMVDVTGIETVTKGDEVVLLGSQQGESITAEDMALWADTISYELLCLLGTRNRRNFLKGE